VILARFVYKNCLFGEWTPVDPLRGPMMVPNPKYADQLLGVEFHESQLEAPPKPRRNSNRAYRIGVVNNG
jgi:hypothetical protein